MSTAFYAVQNIKDTDNKVDNCSGTYKRRKLQNSCFNSQFVDNSSQEIDKFQSPKQLIMSTAFYAIQNDKDIDNKVDNCSATYKRRKLQNSCFNSQFVDNSSQEIEKFQSLSLQLQCDLPAFIDRAKEVFRNNNKENIPDNSSSTFLQSQEEFVNTAVGVYLQHFMPSSSPKLWKLANNITSTAFSQDIDAANMDARNADCYNRSFEDMTIIDDSMDKSLENDESLHNADTSCQDFEFNDCHGTTPPNTNYFTPYSISPLRSNSH
mmetsp:Transcript_21685/g.20985  ORF Transcript_21685/g.20985 Transcript_21685/m.20985 type:complete len:265 (-) Transcript_21685:111-905(-)